VPTFFAQWTPILCDTVGIGAGQKVLDVACGTGIVARTAAERAGPAHVIGVDLNQAMLTVARRVRGDIDWRQGDAAALPLADRSFDAPLCQMVLAAGRPGPRKYRSTRTRFRTPTTFLTGSRDAQLACTAARDSTETIASGIGAGFPHPPVARIIRCCGWRQGYCLGQLARGFRA
jgi:SAM-dependent methyltransferase